MRVTIAVKEGPRTGPCPDRWNAAVAMRDWIVGEGRGSILGLL